MIERGSLSRAMPLCVSFALKMCEFMVLPCHTDNIFKMADDIPVHLSLHRERETERGGRSARERRTNSLLRSAFHLK